MENVDKKDIKKVVEITKNLTRFLGERLKDKLVFVWKYKGLSVMVDDNLNDIIIMDNMSQVVYGDIIKDDILFKPGRWIDIILDLYQKIRTQKGAAEMKKLNNEYVFGPLVEGGA